MHGIRSVDTKKNEKGEYEHVRLVFGPHYYVELRRESDGTVTFVVGATHHGFKADASQLSGELENIINEVRKTHPEASVD